MTIKNLLHITQVSATLSSCTMDMGKTKKACMADKGTWLKDGQPSGAAASQAPAASAAPKK